MATRARIGIENEDGSITTSYHHWDGYPSGLGFNLVNHWADEDLLGAAIALGDASHWADTIGEKTDFDARDDDYYKQNVYYNRDRGESWDSVKPIVYDTYEVFEKVFMRRTPCGEDYAYVLRLDGSWTQLHPYTKQIIHDAEDSIRTDKARMQRLIDREVA